MNKPASIEEAREGLSFANVLRNRLVCGVILGAMVLFGMVARA